MSESLVQRIKGRLSEDEEAFEELAKKDLGMYHDAGAEPTHEEQVAAFDAAYRREFKLPAPPREEPQESKPQRSWDQLFDQMTSEQRATLRDKLDAAETRAWYQEDEDTDDSLDREDEDEDV